MNIVLLITVIAVPLVELAVLIKVGAWLGFWPTFLIIVGTFIAGAMVVSRSGFAALVRVQEALAKGEPPAAAMLEGALHMLAGVLLMTPGIIADLVGLALLVPPIRKLVANYAVGRMLGTGWVHVATPGRSREANADRERPGTGQAHDPPSGPVIEGEFERLDERPVNPRRRPRPTDLP